MNKNQVFSHGNLGRITLKRKGKKKKERKKERKNDQHKNNSQHHYFPELVELITSFPGKQINPIKIIASFYLFFSF